LIDLGVTHGFVEKTGAWYAYQGNKIGQGKNNAKNYLKENPAVAQAIEEALRAKLLPNRVKGNEGEAPRMSETEYLLSNPANARHLNSSIEQLRQRPDTLVQHQVVMPASSNTDGDWFEKALKKGVLEKKHAWIMYGTTTIGRGVEVSRGLIEANPVLLKEILAKVNAGQ
jgi:hypothetical protein